MQDYTKKTAQKGAQQNNAAPVQSQMTNGIPNSVLNDVFAGKRHADSSMMGHSQNLAPSIAAKMSRAFGMDLTGMQVYQSDAMKGTGMRGMAQGSKVVLSSDVDLNTTAGQAVLGHEISHIHAQSQGVGMGHSGLYENAALEHQADTEGLLAAQGRSIYQGGMDAGIGMSYGLGMKGVEGLTPLSGGMSAGAGAPMQADSEKGGIFGWVKGLFGDPDEKAGKSKKPVTMGEALTEVKLYKNELLNKNKDNRSGRLRKFIEGMPIISSKMGQLEKNANFDKRLVVNGKAGGQEAYDKTIAKGKQDYYDFLFNASSTTDDFDPDKDSLDQPAQQTQEVDIPEEDRYRADGRVLNEIMERRIYKKTRPGEREDL